MLTRRRILLAVFFLVIISLSRDAWPGEPRRLALDEIEALLANSVSSRRITVLVKDFGVNFSLSDQQADRLRSLGLEDSAINAIRKFFDGAIPEGGVLRIYSVPEGAGVFVGNENRGTTPLRMVVNPPGRIEIRVGGLEGYQDETREEEARKGEIMDIRFSLKRAEVPTTTVERTEEGRVQGNSVAPTMKAGRDKTGKPPYAPSSAGVLYIETEPNGARIFERGKYIGKTPLEMQLGEGLHVLVLIKDNYETETIPVMITRGIIPPLSVKFIPRKVEGS